jgi:hypothetical protein
VTLLYDPLCVFETHTCYFINLIVFSALTTSDPVASKYRVGFNECAAEISRFLGTIDMCDVELRARLLNHLANAMVGGSICDVTLNSVTSPTKSISPPLVKPLTPLSIRPVPTSTTTLNISPPPSTVLSGTIDLSLKTQLSPLAPKLHTIQQMAPPMEINNNTISCASVTSQLQEQQQQLLQQQQQPMQNCAKLFSGLQVIPTKLPSGEIAFVLPANVMSGGPVPNYVIPVYTPPVASIPSFPASLSTASVTVSSTAPAPGLMTLASPAGSNLQTCTLTSFPSNFNVISSSAPNSVGTPLYNDGKSVVDSTTSVVSVTSSSSVKDEQYVFVEQGLDLSPHRGQVQGHGQDLLALDENVWRPW